MFEPKTQTLAEALEKCKAALKAMTVLVHDKDKYGFSEVCIPDSAVVPLLVLFVMSTYWEEAPKGALAGALEWNLPDGVDMMVSYDNKEGTTTADLVVEGIDIGWGATVQGKAPDLATLRAVTAWAKETTN